MARRRARRGRHGAGLGAMTPQRASRIYRLVTLLTDDQMGRRTLVSRLRVGVRTFYRDLSYLRVRQVRVDAAGDRYAIRGGLTDALGKLIFPDPKLSFTEAMQLAKGRGSGARKLKDLVKQVTRA